MSDGHLVGQAPLTGVLHAMASIQGKGYQALVMMWSLNCFLDFWGFLVFGFCYFCQAPLTSSNTSVQHAMASIGGKGIPGPRYSLEVVLWFLFSYILIFLFLLCHSFDSSLNFPVLMIWNGLPNPCLIYTASFIWWIYLVPTQLFGYT